MFRHAHRAGVECRGVARGRHRVRDGAASPFTTPDQTCSTHEGFLAAGNTHTDLREYVLGEDQQVYTARAMLPWGTVAEPDPASFVPFKDRSINLPESMTTMSGGEIDASGEKLTRFLSHLNGE